MPLLSFTLNGEGVIIFHDVLNCLNKFSESVFLEAKEDRLVFTAFNSTRSAYGRFVFDPPRFSTRYRFNATGQKNGRFYCVMLIQSLLAVFSKRPIPSAQAGLAESSIDRCDISIEDDVGRHSRFIAKILKRNGIRATHRLPFENLAPSHAKFDKSAALNTWEMPAKKLKQLLDHFSPGTELLDIHHENPDPIDKDSGVMNFTCFTEKTVSGDQVLKKPLHTSIAVSTVEFSNFSVEQDHHTTITVRDFKSIVSHASIINGTIRTCFSGPAKPMQLAYSGDGFTCEFLLMTVGERDSDGTRRRKARSSTTRPGRAGLGATSRAGSVAKSTPAPAQEARQAVPPPAAKSMPPPSVPPVPSGAPRNTGTVGSRSQAWQLRPSNVPTAPPRSNFDDESLFVSQNEDEESRWEPVNPEDEATPVWGSRRDGTNQPTGTGLTMNQVATINRTTSENRPSDDGAGMPSGLEPTQRLTDVMKFGLFGN